jgi:hypothetical protein
MEEELESMEWEEDENAFEENAYEDDEYDYENDEPGIIQRIFRFLLRIFVVIVLGIGLGAGLFYGSQKLYRDFIAVAQENRARLDQIENDLALSDEMVETQMDQLEERLVELEGRLAVQAEEIAAFEARVESMRSLQDAQGDEVSELAFLPDDITDLEGTILQIVSKVNAIDAELTARGLPADQLQFQLQLVRTMAILTRARVSLIHDNMGLASQDISAAVEVLNDMLERGTQEQIETIEPILNRLELALEDVTKSPIIAADELEIAWKLLTEATDYYDIPLPTPTPTPEAEPTETAPEEDSNGAE